MMSACHAVPLSGAPEHVIVWGNRGPGPNRIGAKIGARVADAVQRERTQIVEVGPVIEGTLVVRR